MCIREKSIVSFTQINNIGIGKNSFKYLAKALIHFAYYSNIFGKFFLFNVSCSRSEITFYVQTFLSTKESEKNKTKAFQTS